MNAIERVAVFKNNPQYIYMFLKSETEMNEVFIKDEN